MGEVRVEDDFEMSADALWAALKDFGSVDWVPGNPEVELRGEGIGMVRVISIPPLPDAEERLDEIDDANRTVRYSIDGKSPMPVTAYRASMSVQDLGEGRCHFIWSSTWEPDGVSLEDATKAVKSLYKAVLPKMKAFLESQ